MTLLPVRIVVMQGMERTLCISFTSSCGENYYRYIPNVAKMGTKDITKRIKKFVEEYLKDE